jgi:hypothetical protein
VTRSTTNGSRAALELRSVGPEHDAILRSFTCATADDFTLDAQQFVRELLVPELRAGRCQALGSWNGDELVALIAYAMTEGLWIVHMVATRTDYRRSKQALRLKLEVLYRAYEAGIPAVTSHVHRDNEPMLALNRTLNGVDDAPEDSDNPYRVCTVRSRPRPST